MGDGEDREAVRDIWAEQGEGNGWGGRRGNGDDDTEDLLPNPTTPPTTPPSRLRTFWNRVRYYVPILGWLPRYKFRYLQHDLLSGVTVACLLIPQGLSYAQALVKIPPVYGLYTSFVPLLVYAVLGTSRQLAVGPEALVSILVGAAIAEKSQLNPPGVAQPLPPTEGGDAASFITLLGAATEPPPGSGNPANNVAESIAIANLMALMVGLFTFLLGFFRLGFLDSVLSRALLRGFVTAVAVVVVIDLGESLLGITAPVPPDGGGLMGLGAVKMMLMTVKAVVNEANIAPIEKLIMLLENLDRTHMLTAIISGTSIFFLFLMKFLKSQFKTNKILQAVPEILILVLLSTLFSAVFRWDEAGVQVLKDVQTGLVTPKLPNVSIPKVRFYLLSAILISMIGFVESIAVAKTYSAKHNYAVSPNRELVALGSANIVSSCFGSWPAFGSLGRSAVNDAAGSRTQLAGLVTGLIILMTIQFLLPLFYFLPKAVCSSIIVVAALKLIEWHDVGFILRLRAWSDFLLLLLTFFTTIIISIEVGTLISVGTSLLLVMKHTTKTRIAILGRTLVVDPVSGAVKSKFRPMQSSLADEDAGESGSGLGKKKSEVERVEGVLLIKIEEGLFFGNSGQLKDRLKRVEMYGDLGVHPGEAPRRRGLGNRGYGARGVTAHGAGRNEGSPSESLFQQSRTIDSLMEGGFGSHVGSSTSSSFGSPYVPVVNPERYHHDEIRSVIFDVGAVNSIDASATQTLLEIVQSYNSRDIAVCFVKLRDTCRPWFIRSGLYDLVGPDRFFHKIRDAVDTLRGEDRVLDLLGDSLGNASSSSGSNRLSSTPLDNPALLGGAGPSGGFMNNNSSRLNPFGMPIGSGSSTSNMSFPSGMPSAFPTGPLLGSLSEEQNVWGSMDDELGSGRNSTSSRV
ncbi:Solute carrier 26 [Chytridiales sp. JEL 0842]|nr:Solute carrier 26 [Chytridiales sp. JEL 0842]